MTIRRRYSVLVPLIAGALLSCGGSPSDGGSEGGEAPPAEAAVAAGTIQCPDSDTRPTVFVRDCDTGVANVPVDGCSLADQIRQCESTAAEGFVRCIAKTTERLVDAGVIHGRDKGALQMCAADDRELEGERPEP